MNEESDNPIKVPRRGRGPLRTCTVFAAYLYGFLLQDCASCGWTVKHYTGPLLQEQSYYSFGLQMAGISAKALNKLPRAYQFNGGVELDEETGLRFHSSD
ncbi:hypothetical protein [Flaviaesturariibacter aridisoli]|uniref:Uncharacterized protein n=1 Tax=Flaviaesturariibacter aridisoli TaxID=2545761 RepID=A0A4R4E1L9_9BACT|nr:hypothetical protein [Flaviaesturariibacter aridisoli]TCZ73384.1 hypothetical protein E0486_06845 [Flaviaesturariibacter aridisoli]